MTGEDLRVLACQHLDGSPYIAPGARGYLIGYRNGDGGERRVFLFRSRGGRFVRVWLATKRVTNWRLKTIPPEHPLYERLRGLGAPFMAEQEAGMFLPITS